MNNEEIMNWWIDVCIYSTLTMWFGVIPVKVMNAQNKLQKDL